MEKRLLNIKECAQYLSVSTSLLYKSTEAKKFPHVKIGRKILFDIKEINKYIRNNTVKIE